MKSALMVDGGYLRACAKSASKNYDNSLIEQFCNLCFDSSEYKFRIYYYDAPQYKGRVKRPVSGDDTEFGASDKWLDDLSSLERFAVRRGTIGFRGWKPKNIPITNRALTDDDFAPIFEQKGVDMRIGLDIATFAENKTIDRIILISGDTDMVPAMKQARKAGIEICMIQIKTAQNLHKSLKSHSDFIRQIDWP